MSSLKAGAEFIFATSVMGGGIAALTSTGKVSNSSVYKDDGHVVPNSVKTLFYIKYQ